LRFDPKAIKITIAGPLPEALTGGRQESATMTDVTLDNPQRYLTHDRCPLCKAGSDQFRLITAEGKSFTHEKAHLCGNCSLAFLSPRLNPEGLREYYGSDEFSTDFRGADRPDEEADRYRDMRALRRWRFLAPLFTQQARCLEIGCSSGNFLSIVRGEGHEAHGIDPSTGYARHAGRKGLDVTVGEFPHDLPDSVGPFDVIATFHVIEHVHDPQSFLRDIRQRLAPGGLLALEYPDLEQALRRNKLKPTYFSKPHLHDFSQRTMRRLLESAGFRSFGAFTESEFPYDKNVLIVARPAEAAALPPRTDRHDRRHAEQVHRTLRQKLTGRQSAWSRLWTKVSFGRRKAA